LKGSYPEIEKEQFLFFLLLQIHNIPDTMQLFKPLAHIARWQ